ncbi:hypothetical protein SDRG_03468 [Saprolegnia diclina VS20]|uniref:EamA domain-containing protein n=1 Tax=Saprolegnia diclina (strain VS20) TaxID=1156394 RepID=T0S2P2_SAPDV|nr:hypothetical protein SDRG_03468 [Saprolegnia diclina VS20]EQC39263.1 hypothetical protein SDRG_03468 [Saprolegnia diclina VS20]|eukprot:XP_008607324.1 hypothetical protein SDRG_03468 [Saprolegnia diclina VS20]
MGLRELMLESKLVLAVVALVLARCIDRVLNTRITYEYTPFLWFFANIICPVSFLAISWPIVIYKLRKTEDITPEMRAFPHYKFAIMAFLDMASSFLATLPIPHIGGNLANVLGQVTLPLNMLLSMVFLQTRYERSHVIGATMVLYGALVCMIPIFRGEVALNSPDPSFGWLLLYVFSMVPAATSNVYKEIGLKDVDLDIWYTNAWVSTYQVCWGIATMWTIRLPAFSDPAIDWHEFPAYLQSATRCFFGSNLTFHDTDMACSTDIFPTFLQYILFNIVFNTLMMYVFKEGSSVLFVISSAVCLPLTDILYMIPFIAGPKASQAFTIFDGFALFIIVMGMVVYHSQKEKRGKDNLSTSPMYASPSLQRMRSSMEHKRGRKSGYKKLLRTMTPTRAAKSATYGATDTVV